GAGPGGTVTTRFVLDGWKVHQDALGNTPEFKGNENWDVWADLDGSNALLTRYLHGDLVDQVWARISSGGTAAGYLADWHGSVRNLIDAAGVLQNTIAYDGFGYVTRESNPSAGDRWAYTGRERDTETGLQYTRERYYDPKTSRWLNPDPIGLAAGDMNLYRYLQNQPTGGVDPSGMEPPDSEPGLPDGLLLSFNRPMMKGFDPEKYRNSVYEGNKGKFKGPSFELFDVQMSNSPEEEKSVRINAMLAAIKDGLSRIE